MMYLTARVIVSAIRCFFLETWPPLKEPTENFFPVIESNVVYREGLPFSYSSRTFLGRAIIKNEFHHLNVPLTFPFLLLSLVLESSFCIARIHLVPQKFSEDID